MSFNDCPPEIIDHIFETFITSNPEGTLVPLLCVCTLFRDIGQRRLVQHVFLNTNRSFASFARFLDQLYENGRYPATMVPISWLALFGNWDPSRPMVNDVDTWTPKSDTHDAACHIISIAAPSLRSLALYRIGGHNYDRIFDLYPKVGFPKLRELITLTQGVVSFWRHAHIFPNITHLYIGGLWIDYRGPTIDSSSTLRHLRLEYLDPIISSPKIINVNVASLDTYLIDTYSYKVRDMNGRLIPSVTLTSYAGLMKAFKAAAEEKGGVVVAKEGYARVSASALMEAWRDLINGGQGFWHKGWHPVI